MVFSFFKKAPEKMVARPSVNPRAKESSEETSIPQAGMADAGSPLAKPAISTESIANAPLSSGLSDFVFSESSPDFQIEAELDPVDARAEEAAMLFANGQDEAVRLVLEDAVREYRSGKAERLWLMLFDLYRLNGAQTAFESLEIEFASSFEKSPPGWRNKSGTSPKSSEAPVGNLLLKGNLTKDNVAAIDAVAGSFGKQPRMRLDLSKVGALDATGCAHLLVLLQKAKKARQDIELLGRDSLATLVREKVIAGQAENKECWLLFLELCQLQGQHEVFEDAAVDYAVTFEVSPPSWESSRIAAPEVVVQTSTTETGNDNVDAYVLQGQIKGHRFSDLIGHAEKRDSLIIECSGLVRMDFISAGALLNTLTTVRRAGKPIAFRYPNHLVAELFAVVGLNAVATVIFAKY